MYLHTDLLINDIAVDEPDPAAANALQEGLGGQFGEMTSLWVSPHARGLGVGDLAVSRVLTWARDHHPGVGVVLSVKTTNVVAAALYTRHGFNEVGPSPDSPDQKLMVRL